MTRQIVTHDARITERLARQLSVAYDPSFVTSIVMVDAQGVVGGFVYNNYRSASIEMHMAGRDRRWMTRDLVWAGLHYPLVQLGVHKVIAPVAAAHHAAASIVSRVGFQPEQVLRGVLPSGDLILFTLTYDQWRPRWRDLQPRTVRAKETS